MYDIAVIGLGAHGSSTLYQLAKRYPDLKIIGIEKYSPGTQMGSSGGFSRIIRKAYFESPAYVSLVSDSYDLYRDLEADISTHHIDFSTHPAHTSFTPGNSILHITGGLDIGPGMSSVIVAGALQSCRTNNLKHELLTSSQIKSRWPMISLPSDNYVAVFQPDAGFLEPEKTNFAFCQVAQKLGAQTLFHTTVSDITHNTAEGEFEVQTESTKLQEYSKCQTQNSLSPSQHSPSTSPTSTLIRAKKIIICTGPWIQDSMAFSCFAQQSRDVSTRLGLALTKTDKFFSAENTQVQRQVVNWHTIKQLNPDRSSPYDSPNFPIFIIHHRIEDPTSDIDTRESDTNPQLPILSSNSNEVAHRDADGNIRVDQSNTTHIDHRAAKDFFYYGFPSMRPGDHSMKIGLYHHLFETQHQDELNRAISFQDIMCTARCAQSFFPFVALPEWYNEADEFLKTNPTSAHVLESAANFPLSQSNTSFNVACSFCNSFDGHFLIQPLFLPSRDTEPSQPDTTPSHSPHNPNIVYLQCCSGHGFKFSSIIGLITAQLITTGRSDRPIDWLSVDRTPLSTLPP